MDNSTDTGKFDWEDLAAGGYSGINSALFGIPDVLVNVANKDAYKALQDLRSRNKIASTVGDVAGMFAPTGGLLAKGIGSAAKLGAGALKGLNIAKGANAIGKIAKGADTVSDIIKTGGQLKGIGGAAIRGGLTAAEQALPRVLGGQQDLGQAAENIAMGGALGGGFKAAGNVLSGLKKALPLRSIGLTPDKIQESLRDSALSGRGLTSQMFKKAMNESAKNQGLTGSARTGFIGKNADELKDAALNMFKKHGLETDDDIAEFLAGEGEKWNSINAIGDKAGLNVASLNIGKDPEIIQLLQTYGDDAKKALDEVMKTAMSGKDIAQTKKILQKNIQLANKATDLTGSLRGDVTRVIKEKLDDAMLELDPNYAELKSTWSQIQPLRQMLAMEKSKISNMVTGGSDTAAKQLMGKILLGGGAGAAVSGFDPSNPETWGKTAVNAALGAGALSAGNILNKVTTAGTQKLLGKAAEGALDLAPKASELVETISAKAKPALSKLSDFMGKLEKPSTALEKMAGATPSQVVEKIITSEETATPETVETAKADVNEKYMGVLKSTLQQDYQQYFANQMSYEDFEKQVADLTDNFNPVKTAGVIFKDPSQRDKYLKDYNIALKLKDVDVGTIGNAPNLFEAVTNPQSVSEQKKAYSDMIDTISTLVTNEGDLPSKAVKEQIAADVKVIADLPASKEEKQKLLMDKLGEKYGLDLQTLTALGVV